MCLSFKNRCVFSKVNYGVSPIVGVVCVHFLFEFFSTLRTVIMPGGSWVN
jgi:hypothetical protein